MDYTNIVIAACTAIGTILALASILGKRFDKMDKRFDKIEYELRLQGERIARIEGYLEGSNHRNTGTEK